VFLFPLPLAAPRVVVVPLRPLHAKAEKLGRLPMSLWCGVGRVWSCVSAVRCKRGGRLAGFSVGCCRAVMMMLMSGRVGELGGQK